MLKKTITLFLLSTIAFIMLFTAAATFSSSAVSAEDDSIRSEVDNKTDLSDGKYKIPKVYFKFEGGTGKAKYFCKSVTIRKGRAYAELSTESTRVTHFFMGEKRGKTGLDEDNADLYDPHTGKIGNDVYEVKNGKATVPVKLDEKAPFSARTTAMSTPHWVQYHYMIEITKARRHLAKKLKVKGVKAKIDKRGKLVVQWKRVPQASGYVLEAKKGAFTQYKKLRIFVASGKAKAKLIVRIKKKRVHSLRIRTYKVIHDKKVNGIWTYSKI